jgi:hypothetical protein
MAAMESGPSPTKSIGIGLAFRPIPATYDAR